jgi:hypothetical protein
MARGGEAGQGMNVDKHPTIAAWIKGVPAGPIARRGLLVTLGAAQWRADAVACTWDSGQAIPVTTAFGATATAALEELERLLASEAGALLSRSDDGG